MKAYTPGSPRAKSSPAASLRSAATHCIAIAVATALAFVGACTAQRPTAHDGASTTGGGLASSNAPAAMSVPPALRAPDMDTPSLVAHGAGVQIYECGPAAGNPAMFEWKLKGPEAELHYDAGKPLGKHYAGPTWEGDDGSKVVGEVVSRSAAPDATAIPWLLLRATSTSGSGVFGAVKWIQRLHTVGGQPPTTGCAAGYAGTEVRVDYSADYVFYDGK